jgi:hypothetical protein
MLCTLQENLRRTGLDSDEDEGIDEEQLFGSDGGDDDAGDNAANGGDEDAAGAAAAGSGRGRLKRRAAAAAAAEDDADAGAEGNGDAVDDEVMDEAPGEGGFEVDALFADDDAGDEVRELLVWTREC